MREIRQTKTISGRNILREMNELREQGYTRLWAGNGQICMEAPATQVVVVNQPVPPDSDWTQYVNWTPLLYALGLAELDPAAVNDFMWMGESPAGVQQYKNRDTRNYAHLTGTETRDEALAALNHAYNGNEKWANQPRRTTEVARCD